MESFEKNKSWTVKKSKKYKPQIGDIYENHSMIYDVSATYQSDGSIIYFVKYSMESEEWGFADAPIIQKSARYKTK